MMLVAYCRQLHSFISNSYLGNHSDVYSRFYMFYNGQRAEESIERRGREGARGGGGEGRGGGGKG